MNFFYKETPNKKLHYYRGKTDPSPIFSIARGTALEDVLSSAQKKFFRLSALVLDLFTLNVVIFILLYFFLYKNDPNNKPFFLTANLAWIVSSYFTALYFGKVRFLLRTIQSYFLYIALALLAIFLLKSDPSRLFVLLSFSVFGVSLVLTRVLFLGTATYIKNNKLSNSFIVLGCNDLSHKLVANLRTQSRTFQMRGFFDDFTEISNKKSVYPILGGISDCLPYALQNNVAEIYSTIPPENCPEIYDIAQEAEKNFIRFRFVPDFSIFINRRVHMSFVSDLPVLSLRQEPLEDLGSSFKKRMFDIMFSSIVIIFILSWLVPIIAILIKLDSKGPVFFRQLRSGKNNMPFLCFKFRSLKINDEADMKQVTKNDGRYTRLGKFLRKTNLDEFPQFFNVFQGYMSVVGPRPHMLKHTEQYSEVIKQYMIRHYVKPGLTGLAQVNGYRGEITKEEDLSKRIDLDIKYMENWSLLLDIQIIVQTIYVSLKGDKNAF